MAKATDVERVIRVRIIVVNPPDMSEAGDEFGLQDKDQRLYPGVAQADGSLHFECELRVKQGADGKPNFLGGFAQGSADDRFLYLTTKWQGQIQSRIKVKLGTITWAQVEAAGASGALEASIDGRGAASVKLLGEGWQVVGST